MSLVGTALPGVSVTYGRPMDTVLPREAVYVGDVRGQHRIPVMKAARKAREESFTVDVVVAVLMPRGTIADAEARAFVLATQVENVLADDPSLGGVDGLIHATAGSFRSEPDFAQEGPVAVVVIEVDCLSRLS